MNMHVPARRYGQKDTSRADDHNELKAVMDALAKRDAEIKAFAEKATAEIKDTGKMAAETKAALDKLVTEGSALQERMLAVEQKLARRPGGGGGPETKGIATQFVESDDFKALQAKGRGVARFNIKAASTITSVPHDPAASPPVTGGAGALIRPERLPGVVAPMDRQFVIRDLLLPGTTSSNAVEYVEETGFQNAAAPVAENPDNPKPQSDLTFELKTSPVRTIAHWFAASRQVLNDIPLLLSYIDNRARYGLRYVEENQLLAGNGVGQNLNGLVPQATPFDAGLLSAHTSPIDVIRRAALQVRLTELRPTFVVMHPTDWAAMELHKSGADERYTIVLSVALGAEMRVWRLSVVETLAVEEGHFLVGATGGAQVFDREESAVEVSTEHADFFTRNLVAIRAEERLALTVTRPEAFVYGEFPSE